MARSEGLHIIAAMIILSIISSITYIVNKNLPLILLVSLFSVLIISVSIISKKIMAYSLDASVEHQIWPLSRYGMRHHWHFKQPIPAGVIIPLFFSVFSLGYLKVMTLLTYETRALKVRAAKRFGFYSFSEMTDWHNGLVGAAGIFAVLLLSVISYFIGGSLETLAKMSAFYAFWNILPISTLDGNQIFFGSRVLWSTLAIIVLIFATYALFLV